MPSPYRPAQRSSPPPIQSLATLYFPTRVHVYVTQDEVASHACTAQELENAVQKLSFTVDEYSQRMQRLVKEKETFEEA